MIEYKDRLGEVLDFDGLNILVLSNRIDGLEQFRDDLLNGRGDKKAILPDKILEKIESRTFHSKADDMNGLPPQSEEDEVQNFGKSDEKSKHTIYFSTYQTAAVKQLEEKFKNIDMIIIDEVHNVRGEGNAYFDTIQKLEHNGRNGVRPIILGLTATPDNITKENFGEPFFRFGLAEYLASEYAPGVNYNIVASSAANKNEVENLKERIDEAKNIEDYDKKKEFLKIIEEEFDRLMAKVPSVEALCKDILEKVIDGGEKPQKTIIFANSIKEADNIAKALNGITRVEYTKSYHSQTTEKNILSALADENSNTQILV